MRKLYFAILCLIENIRATIYCCKCGVTCNKLNARTELVDQREALHLLGMGFEPMHVDYNSNGEHDTFNFRRTAALLMALADYRRAIREAVRGVEYEDYVTPCDISGSKISPIDEVALNNIIAPRGNARESFAYVSWPVEKRQAYIAADADTRRRMVDEAYQRR